MDLSWVRVGLLLCCACVSAAAQSSFCDQVKALTEQAPVAAAHWGVSVTTLGGETLCALNEAQLFRPASNNKLFTTAAALSLLGADRRFSTRVEAEGDLHDGVLRGSLRLVGGGDANFGGHDIPYVAPALRPKEAAAEPASIADIEDLADQVYAAGVRRVEGDVVGDDGYFAWEPYPPDWAADDLVYGYGAPVSGLTIHDNQIEMQVYPENDRARTSSAKAILKMIPEVPYYAVENDVWTRDLGHDCGARLTYERALGSKHLVVYGDIPPNPAASARPCTQEVAIQDPAEYAALALKLALERRGVRVSGVARAQHVEMRRLGSVIREEPEVKFMLPRTVLNTPYEADRQPIVCQAQAIASAASPKRTVLATHEGPRLIDDITYTSKVSQNLHAEVLLRNLGATFACEHTQSTGVAVVREYLLHAGIAAPDFVLFDGSGLSGHDLVAPRALARLLAYAATQPWFESWRATLPVGGVDGSLGARFGPPNSTLKGRVMAKTGTLGESRALSGYVTAASGQTLIFSVMVDNHVPSTAADRAAMDQVVELIAARN